MALQALDFVRVEPDLAFDPCALHQRVVDLEQRFEVLVLRLRHADVRGELTLRTLLPDNRAYCRLRLACRGLDHTDTEVTVCERLFEQVKVRFPGPFDADLVAVFTHEAMRQLDPEEFVEPVRDDQTQLGLFRLVADAHPIFRRLFRVRFEEEDVDVWELTNFQL